MPFNGSGVYQRVRNWMADATAGIKIRADLHDSEDDGFALGLTNCITKDGQSLITQNIPFNSKRITGLADPVNPQDAVTKAYTDTKVTTLPPPVNAGDATNKAYVDAGDVALQANIDNANANANNRVLRSGDTMTGQLVVPNINLSGRTLFFADGSHYLSHDGGGTFTFTGGGLNITGGLNTLGNTISSGPINCGAINANGTSQFVDRALVVGGAQPVFAVHNTGRSEAWGFWVDAGQTGMLIGSTDGAGTPAGAWLRVSAGVPGIGLTSFQGAFKPGGGVWADTSDARIKNVLGDYTSGLDAVTALNPVRFTFKGNDTVHAGDTSSHATAAAEATEFVGLIAQDAKAALPEMVTTIDAYIDGAAVTDLHQLDTTPLIYALINAIKELKARVETLEGR